METITPQDQNLYVDTDTRFNRDSTTGAVYDVAPPAIESPNNIGNASNVLEQSWGAPDASTRVELPTSPLMEATAYNSRLARGLERVSKFFGRAGEISETANEKARRFFGRAGNVALRGFVELKTIPTTYDYAKEKYMSTGETRRRRVANNLGRAVNKLTNLESEQVSYDEYMAVKPITKEDIRNRRNQRIEKLDYAKKVFMQGLQPSNMARSSAEIARFGGEQIKKGGTKVESLALKRLQDREARRQNPTAENPEQATNNLAA
jgi:hypothetical protein